MFFKPQFSKAGQTGRPGPSLAGGLFMLALAASAPLAAQTDFNTDSIFQAPAEPVSGAPAPSVAETPPLPPAASDPFNLPPAGSIPLGSSAPPLTSPAASAPEFPDDPFGTPAPEDRQVRQVAPAPDQPAPAAAAAPAAATGPASAAQEPAAPPPPPAEPAPPSAYVAPEASQTLDEAQRARLRALFPDMLPPEDQTISALTPPPAPADPEPPEEDGAAIGRAGSLLTKEYYGQAQILPSLDSPPALEDDASKSAAPAKADAAKSAGAAKGKPAPAAKGQAEAKTEPTRTAKAQDSQGRTPAPPRGSLALVNETGDPQVGAVYQSALSRLGYTILAGPAGGFSQGPAGQTVIYYRPGAQDRALAVSRDLPGRKTLAEAPPGAAASDVIVVLR